MTATPGSEAPRTPGRAQAAGSHPLGLRGQSARDAALPAKAPRLTNRVDVKGLRGWNPPHVPLSQRPSAVPRAPPTVPSRGSGTGTGALTRSERLPWGQESDAGKLLSASGVWGGL